MTDPVRITVITVAFNAAKTIEETLRSVAEQDYPWVEHIVIDGASTDGTQEMVQRHGENIARFVSEPDQGVWDAMNKGIAMATGDVIGFLNADDVFADYSVLQKIARVFEDPRIQACHGDLVYVDPDDTSKVVRYWKSRPYTQGLFRKGWMPAHPTFYVRRAVYEELGGFDLRYPKQSDFELTMRFMGIAGIRSLYLPEVLVRMRRGGISNRNMGAVLRAQMDAYRACKDHGLPVSPFFMVRKVLSRIPQFLAPRIRARRSAF